MRPSIDELIRALPELEDGAAGPAGWGSFGASASPAGCPPPVGLSRRLWALGGLHTKIGLAYLAYWVRGWARDADGDERERMEVHLRAALALLGTMGYLRGAVMKFGQLLANFTHTLPDEFIEALDRLHFEAPPMHFALVRERIRDELGCEPEEAFASFQTRAIAAASIGQVHRAVLPCGGAVAVKVQYPGIGRAIGADFRALSTLLLPLRLTGDWEGLKAQFEDVRHAVTRETDYRHEAGALRRARSLFRAGEGVVVPRVHDEYSSRRVLTMEFVAGAHLGEFLAGDPPQRLRDALGARLYRALCRLVCAGRLLYADPHPGNVLFGPDGQLGLIDFGCVRPVDDDEWAWYRRVESAFRGNDPIRLARRLAALEEGGPTDPDHLDSLVAWSRWLACPSRCGGAFDFGDGDYLREGMAILPQIVGRRFVRGRPSASLAIRGHLGTVAILHRLRARVDVRTIWSQERDAADPRASP